MGIFPEQAANWDWIADRASAARRPPRILNLFAYTGGSTLAAAAAGASVVHVDAARNVVGWARRNAELSGLADRPIRWIAEDARKFVEREIRRGNRYDAVILDPPSYGHGPTGQVWKLEDDLAPLLALCRDVTAGEPDFLLVTCHTPGLGHDDLAALLRATFGPEASIESSDMWLATATGRHLPCGTMARLTSTNSELTRQSRSSLTLK